MEKTTNFMNRIRTIARKNQFQYMVLENYAIPAVRFTPNDYWEKMEIRKNMDDLISTMDKNRIPWKLQNSLFYIGEKYDVRSYYVSDLCNMAYKRAYA